MGNAATLLGCQGEEEDVQGGHSLWDVFDVGEKLGSGNFGEVRACHRRDESGGREELAVKIVDRQSSSVRAAEAFQTARDELDIMSSLSHPHVVELKHVFEDQRFLYVVMELVVGGELFKAISDRSATILEEDIARVGLQLLDALDYLHGISIVHRDIKAQNILLIDKPQVPGRALKNADVKLIDFGLATRLKQECIMGNEAQLDLVCGTPAMCAPEIWASQDGAPKSWKKLWGTTYGPKVDVWAAGVVLYMALLGKLPFNERKASRLAYRVCDEKETPTFETKGFQVTAGCRRFLGSLLEKDQHRRPSSAQACRDGWLNGRSKRVSRRITRGLQLGEDGGIPHEVRAAALLEAEAALRERFPAATGDDDDEDSDADGAGSDDDLVPEHHGRGQGPGRASRISVVSAASVEEVAERSATFERLRRKESTSRAFARAGPPSRDDSRPAASDSEDTEDGTTGWGC